MNNIDERAAGADPRFAAPAAEVADIAVTHEDRLAGRATRLLAGIIDGLIQGLALWLVSRGLSLSLFEPAPSWRDEAIGLLISLGVFVLIQGALLVQRGQTLGKLVTGIRIVRSDGGRPTPQQLALRYGVGWLLLLVPVAGYLFALVDGLFIFRADRRCVHDLIAGTIVVKV